MARVLIVGRYPPPIGGITVHIKRLASKLLRGGHDTVVLDLYTGRLVRTTETQAEPNSDIPLRLVDKLRWIRYLPKAARGAIVHFHVSDGANFFTVLPLLAFLIRRATKRVLTLHGGYWVDRFRELGSIQRWLTVSALRSFDDIICVNQRQRDELAGLVPARLHVIPAYLPSSSDDVQALPEVVTSFREQLDAVLVTSGYGRALYDYETVLLGVQLAQQELGMRLGLVVATYSFWEHPYWERIVPQLAVSPVPVLDVRNLSPSQFVRLLGIARIYIRATHTDGDAVAIREAASVGTQVIASDAVVRPPGTALFSTGDAHLLARSIVQGLNDPEVGRLSSAAAPDAFEQVLQIYGT